MLMCSARPKPSQRALLHWYLGLRGPGPGRKLAEHDRLAQPKSAPQNELYRGKLPWAGLTVGYV